MTQGQKNTACAFMLSVLLSGGYMLLWLSRIWSYRPWPISSNMVNYGIVLLVFGAVFLLVQGVLTRYWSPRLQLLDAWDDGLRAGRSTPVVAAAMAAAGVYLLYYVLYAVDTEMAAPKDIRTALTDPRVVPLFYLLTILFFAGALYCLLRERDCPVWLRRGGYILSAVLYFGGLFLVNYFVADSYHGEAYLESIYNVADGIPYEELTTGIYGHYGLFFWLPMKLFGAVPLTAQICIALTGVMTDLALLCCIHQLLEKNWARLLFALAVPAVPFAYRQTNYWQLQPHRLVFPAVLAAYVLAVVKRHRDLKPKSAAFWGGWVLCMLAVLWNTESGLFCILGWCAGCVVAWWQQNSWLATCQWRRYGAMVAGAALSVLGAIGLTNLYNLVCGGAPIFKIFFFPLYRSGYMDDSIGYPIRLGVRPWAFILLLFAAVLAWAMSHTEALGGKDRAHPLAPFAACLSVLGLASFSYYANRSAWMNLEICLPEVLLCLCLPVQRLTSRGPFRTAVRGLKATVEDAAGLIAVLVVCVFAAQLPGGAVNTAVLYEAGAFSMQGVAEELENLSAHVPDNTFAVGQNISTLYHTAGWDNYGHYVDAADYGVADPEKLKAKMLDDLLQQPAFVIDDTVCTYLWDTPTAPELPGYVLQSTFGTVETLYGAGQQQNTINYYYVQK